MNKSSHASVNWNHTKIKSAFLRFDNFSDVLLNRYGQIFEEYSGNKSEPSSNSIIAGDWLYKFLHSVIGTYELVKISRKREEASPIPIFLLTEDFVKQTFHPIWWDHIYYMVITVLDGKSPKFEWMDQRQHNVSSRNDLLIRLKQTIANSKSLDLKISLASAMICLSPNKFGEFNVKWASRKWSKTLFFPPATVFQNADRNFREYQFKNWENLDQSLSEVESICLKLLPLYIPLELLEARTSIRDQAMSIGFNRTPFLFSSAGLHNSPLFKNLASEWRVDGTKLLYYQHGGMYGMVKQLPAEDYERKSSDHFFTWGWTDDGGKNSVLRPGVQKVKFSSEANNTLLVCLDIPKFPYQICYAPMPNSLEKLVSQTETFLQNFNGNISVKPYHKDYGNNMTERMMLANPLAKLLDSKSGNPRYYEYSLVICNYLGSTWIESIGYGIPTICFFDDKVYKFRESMLTVIERLMEVGIIHNSAKRAAIFASEVSKDPYGWWQSDDVETAKQILYDSWGGFGVNWKNEWQNKLTTFIN